MCSAGATGSLRPVAVDAAVDAVGMEKVEVVEAAGVMLWVAEEETVELRALELVLWELELEEL